MASDPPVKGPTRVVRLANYEVLSHIATGGMGAVYRARDTETGCIVAVKVLPPEAATRPNMLERFRREARAAERLQHENIVKLHEFGEYQGIYYLAMEFVEGVDLHEHVERKGPLSPKEASYIVLQAARALHHAYKQGIVHRDIKPSNFLLTRKDGRLLVKLTDMGLAREVDNDEFRLTREGTTVGTVDYMSPEQARDSNSADTRSDIYSLGCTFYHMLTGKAPFPEGSLTERLFKHMEDEPPDVRTLNPGVSPALAKVLARMLAKLPEERCRTPKELMQALVHGEKETPSSHDALQSLAAAERSGEAVTPAPRKKQSTPLPTPASTPQHPLPPREKEEAKKPAKAEARKRPSWLLPAGGGGLAVLALILGIVLTRSRTPDHSSDPPPDKKPSQYVQRPPGPVKPPGRPPPVVVKPRPPDKRPAVVWPPLQRDATLDKAALRRDFEAGLVADPKPPADAPVYRVSRLPQGENHYASLAEAARAAEKATAQGEKGKAALPPSAIIIEIHDNGPLFETPSAFAGKDVFLRAGSGYRPLIFWEAAGKRATDVAPLLSVRGGNLTVTGLDFTFFRSRPETVRRAFVRVSGGGFFAQRCSFSAAGSHPAGVVLARLESAAKAGKQDRPARCRLHRCQARGPSLVALDLDARRPDVLIDECLLVGRELPLLEVRARGDGAARLRLLRSTLVGDKACLRVHTDLENPPRKLMDWQAWDVVLARPGRPTSGVLLELPAKSKPAALRWQATNCLYAGWKDFLKGPVTVAATDRKSRERYGFESNVERVASEGWPEASFPDLASVATAEYRTDTTPDAPVGYAATSWPVLAEAGDKAGPVTLGCPVARLPRLRDNWMQWTARPFVLVPVEMQGDPSRYDLPARTTDNRYHGERLDVTQVNVGAHLEQIKTKWKGRLAATVLLRLFRSGEGKIVPTSPLRLKGTNLILVFEAFERPKGEGTEAPAMEEAERLVLTAETTSTKAGQALIEVEGGSLDVIGGGLRFPDFQRALLPPYLIRVKGGDLRVRNCHLQGPLFDPSNNFRGLIRFEGSGQAPDPEAGPRAPQCAIGLSVLTSPRGALSVAGIGARVRCERSVVVAGTDAFAFAPGRGPHARMALSCVLERVTVAARRTVVHVGAVGRPLLPADPLVIQSQRCAFLNPFGERAGMLRCEGAALRNGAILWQSNLDVFDKRLHDATTAETMPARSQPLAVWRRLWGAFGNSRPVTALPLTARFKKDRWSLALLRLPTVRRRPLAFDPREVGPDFVELGLVKKPKRRGK